jgi:hypothetical protein
MFNKKRDMVDGDFFENISDFSFGDIYTKQYQPHELNIKNLRNNIKRTPILFTNTEKLPLLLKHLYSINEEVIIISHNSDVNINDDSLIDMIPSNVLRIWCQNYNGSINDIIKPIPIGLERKRWFPSEKKQDIILEYSEMVINKEYLVYMNFNIITNNIRIDWKEYFQGKDYVYTEMLGNGYNFKNYINNIKKSLFTLSPEGNGIDCHRNWECLEVGSIPIIKRNNFTESIYSDMPVLLIDDIKDVNEKMLNDYLDNEYKNRSLDKLSCEYWKKEIYKDVKEY